MLRRAALGLIALFACAAVAHAQQPAEPLTLKLTSSRQLCTAGTLTQVSWIISGGAPPYALAINGEEVAAAAPHALASCGAMVDDGLEWLLGIGRQRHITAVATDSLGAAATASARLTLAAALDPPTDAQSRSFLVWLHTPVPVQFEFGDPQIRTRWRAETPLRQPAARYMLLRWRVQGADRWAYEAPAPVERFESEQLHKWSVDKSLIDRVLEIQLAHLRRGIERESPHAHPLVAAAADLRRAAAGHRRKNNARHNHALLGPKFAGNALHRRAVGRRLRLPRVGFLEHRCRINVSLRGVLRRPAARHLVSSSRRIRRRESSTTAVVRGAHGTGAAGLDTRSTAPAKRERGFGGRGLADHVGAAPRGSRAGLLGLPEA